MKKSKLALALSLAVMLPAGVAFAADGDVVNGGSALTFGGTQDVNGVLDSGWELSGTTVNFVCPAGFTCGSSPISDAGFLQVQMTDDVTGKMLFRTIIAESDGMGSFTSENYVAAGQGANGGILASQSLVDNMASGNLVSDTTLTMGSFNSGAEDVVTLSQGIGTNSVANANAPREFYTGFTYNQAFDGSTTLGLTQEILVNDSAGTNTLFSDSFVFNENKNAAGVSTGKALDIVSGVNLNLDNPTGATGSIIDQNFSYQVREGDLILPTGAGDNTLNGSVVAWDTANNPGVSISRTLIGQTVTGAGDFGYEAATSSDTSAAGSVAAATDFSLAALAPLGTTTGTNPFGTVSATTLGTNGITAVGM